MSSPPDRAGERAANSRRERGVLVVPDSFKGTVTAVEAAHAVAQGLRTAGRTAWELPAGDGGEGTMNALVAAVGGELRTATVSDPLERPAEASFALLQDGRTAVVETAQASGLWRVAEHERTPRAAWEASTRGTGELIAAAVHAGAETVLVTVGGSATTDGGAGALAALDEAGVDPRLMVLCDVQTTWEQAPRIFSRQKGADPDTVSALEGRLEELAENAPPGRDPRGVTMTGAGGGLAGGLWSHRHAKLVRGAAYVLDLLRFNARMQMSAFVVTGEGCIDDQTLQGKLPAEVATRCRGHGTPCRAVAGRNALAPDKARAMGLTSIHVAQTLAALEAAGEELAAL